MPDSRLLMVSRDDILKVSAEARGERLYRLLARLTRLGFQFLATAPQPDDWSRDHGGPDDALLGPESIRKRLADAGGTIDGIYYVPRSLFTQRRNREEALRDIMQRYAITPGQCYLYSSSRKFVEAAASLGIAATALSDDRPLMPELRLLLKEAERA
jgi:hypothetical protein